jgi:hypothetical protein
MNMKGANESNSWNCHPADPGRPNTKENSQEKPYNGIIVIRLKHDYANREGDDLRECARTFKLMNLLRILEDYKEIGARRAVKSVAVEKLAELETTARKTNVPPIMTTAEGRGFKGVAKYDALDRRQRVH